MDLLDDGRRPRAVNAPPFPRSEAELDAWHVYADWLLERRDPRGPLLALDLALPARPGSSALDRFRRSGQRLKSLHRGLRDHAVLGWCLAHVRTMQVSHAANPAVLLEALAHPTMQLLEEVELLARIEELTTPRWLALLRALPSSCRRLVIDAGDSPLEGERFVDAIPRAIDALVVVRGRPEVVVYDELSEVDVRDPIADVERLGLLVSRLASTTRVEVRAASLPSLPGAHARLRIGHPGEAAFVSMSARRVVTLLRPTLLAQEGQHGLLPIRLLLGRTLPERHPLSSLIPRAAYGWGHPDVIAARDPAGRHLVRSRDARISLAVDGAPVPINEWTLLTDGARLTVAGVDWTFVEDVERE